MVNFNESIPKLENSDKLNIFNKSGSFDSLNLLKNLEKNTEDEQQEEIPGEIKDEIKPEGKKPQWGNFQSPSTYQGKPDPTADEDMFQYLLRGSARVASRLFEQGTGSVGNLEKLSKNILSEVPLSTPIIGWAISELVGDDRWRQIIKGRPGEEQMYPTSQQIKDISQKLTKGYTSPKTKGEERFDEFVEDVGSTLITAGRGGTRTQQAINHLLIPAAANVTKNIVEDLGFGKDKAAMAKTAVWLPMMLWNNVNGPQYASQLMNNGRNGFNQNLTVNVPQYQNQVRQAQRNMLQGDPRSSLAQQQLAGIQNDLANGQTSMRDLMTRYDAINAAKRDRGLFELSRGDRNAAIRNINEVRDVVRDQITNLGQTNPQALRDWQNGVQAWATIHRSNAITNYVQELASGRYAKILTGPAAALFGIGSYGASSSPLIAGPAALIAAGGYKTSQVLYRMYNDPSLRNYYWRAIAAATAENTPAFIEQYEKLNRELEKKNSKKK